MTLPRRYDKLVTVYHLHKPIARACYRCNRTSPMQRSKMLTTCQNCAQDVCLECSTLNENNKRICLTCWYYAFDMATHMKTGGSLRTDTFNMETSKGPQHFDMTKNDSDCEQKSTSEPNSDYPIIDDDMLSDGGGEIANDIESHRPSDHEDQDVFSVPPLDLGDITNRSRSSSEHETTSS